MFNLSAFFTLFFMVCLILVRSYSIPLLHYMVSMFQVPEIHRYTTLLIPQRRMTVTMANATDESLAHDYKRQWTTEKLEEAMQVIDVLNFHRWRRKGEGSRREIAHETCFDRCITMPALGSPASTLADTTLAKTNCSAKDTTVNFWCKSWSSQPHSSSVRVVLKTIKAVKLGAP